MIGTSHFFATELNCSLDARARAAPAPLGARAQSCRRRLRPRTAGLAAAAPTAPRGETEKGGRAPTGHWAGQRRP